MQRRTCGRRLLRPREAGRQEGNEEDGLQGTHYDGLLQKAGIELSAG